MFKAAPIQLVFDFLKPSIDWTPPPKARDFQRGRIYRAEADCFGVVDSYPRVQFSNLKEVGPFIDAIWTSEFVRQHWPAEAKKPSPDVLFVENPLSEIRGQYSWSRRASA
jgi:hypothetical protein